MEENTKLPFIYDFARSFGRRVMGQPGWATVAVNGKYGIIDLKGKYIVPPNYDFASEINNGYFMVQKDAKWGVFNEFSKLVIPLEYDYIYPQVSLVKTIAAVKNKKWGVLKADNSILVPFEYDLIAPDYYGYGDYNAYKDGGSMKINPDGKIVKKGEEEFKYNSDFKFKITSLDNVGVGLKTKGGEVLLPNEYDDIDESKNNLPYYEVSKDDKVGLYKANSREWILPMKHDGLFMANETILCAETYVDDEKSTYQYLDLKGKPLFDVVYDEASYFNFTSQNFAVVKKGKYYGVIDQNGKIILPFDLLEKPDFNLQNFLIIHKTTGFGVLRSDLSTIVPALYAQTTYSYEGKQTNPFADWRNEDYFIVLDNKSITHGILKKDGTFALPLGKYSLSIIWADRKKKVKQYFANVEDKEGKRGLWNVN